jgi:ABC-type amino acid transport substrate-binding protein
MKQQVFRSSTPKITMMLNHQQPIRTLTLLFVVGFFVFFSGCTNTESHVNAPTAPSPLEKLNREHVIDAGYVIYPPAIVRDPSTGHLSGPFIDAFEAIAHEAGAKIRYHEATWTNFAAGLQTHQYDVVVAATYITIPRSMTVEFTRPLLFLGGAAVVRANETRFRVLSDLNRPDVTLALTQGSGEHQFANRELPLAKKTIIGSVDLTLPFLEISAGRADAALNDVDVARAFTKEHPGTKVILDNPPLNLTGVAWPVRQGDQDWLSFLNHSLEFLETTGQLALFERRAGVVWAHRISPIR